MSEKPDFTDAEIWTIQSTVNERWGNGTVELHLADVEIKANSKDTTLTACPAVFFHAEGSNFVLIKVGQQQYRNQFFYNMDLDPIGTGIDEYDNIADCVVALLQTQADDKRIKNGIC